MKSHKSYAGQDPVGMVKAGLLEPQCPICKTHGVACHNAIKGPRHPDNQSRSRTGKTRRYSLNVLEHAPGSKVTYSDRQGHKWGT